MDILVWVFIKEPSSKELNETVEKFGGKFVTHSFQPYTHMICSYASKATITHKKFFIFKAEMFLL